MATRTATVLALVGVTLPVSGIAQQTVTLGEAAARSDDGFSAISGLRELADGSLLLADGLENQLLHVTRDLDASTRVGREGAGPDEYRTPDALYALAGDSTLMVDLGNGRLAVLAPDGSVVRTHPIAGGEGRSLTIMMPGAVDEAGRVFFRKMSPPGPGGLPDSAAVARFDPSTERTVDVANVKLPAMTQQTSGGSNARQQVVRPVPLSPQDAWTATSDGRLVVARQNGAAYWLEFFGPDRVTRGPDIAYDPLPVKTADKEAWVAALAGALGVSVENENGRLRTTFSRGGAPEVDPDDFQWPDTKPAFPDRALWAGPNGRFWLERDVPAGEPRRFDVLDGSGRRLAIVRLPADRRLEGFGRDALYLSRTDDLDFVWLERYRLPNL